MKTKRVSARLTPLDINKAARLFGYPTIRALIEATIQLGEIDQDYKAKLRKIIDQKRKIS